VRCVRDFMLRSHLSSSLSSAFSSSPSCPSSSSSSSSSPSSASSSPSAASSSALGHNHNHNHNHISRRSRYNSNNHHLTTTHLHPHPDLWRKKDTKKERDKAWAWLSHFASCLHSLLVLFLGTAVMVIEVPGWQLVHWTKWFNAPTTYSQSVIFVAMVTFYCCHSLLMLYRALYRGASQHLISVLHHCFCIAGLLNSIYFGVDGALILVGGLVAEIANPIRHLLLANMTKSECCSYLVFLPFLITRLVLVQYTAHAVLPYSKMLTTRVLALALLGLSAHSMWRYVLKHKKNFQTLL